MSGKIKINKKGLTKDLERHNQRCTGKQHMVGAITLFPVEFEVDDPRWPVMHQYAKQRQIKKTTVKPIIEIFSLSELASKAGMEFLTSVSDEPVNLKMGVE